MNIGPETEKGHHRTGIDLPDALLAAAESLTGRIFALDPEGAAAFEPIHGRVIAIEILGMDTRISLIPTTDRIQVFGRYGSEPDCLIRGAPLALLRLLGSEQKGSEIGAGDVSIEGDTALAHDLSRAMAGLDLDWEEQLSRLVPDPVAHRIGSGLRAAGEWGRSSADTLRTDIKEYLEEEGRLVPTRFELDRFLGEVDTLRDDAERLAARLERLERSAAQGKASAEQKTVSAARGGRPRKGTKQPR